MTCQLIRADRYSQLPRAAQKALFLTKIQLPLLDSYHSRISASLDAFETLSSVFVRPVPGALSINLTTRETSGVQENPRNLTVGVAGVHRLCKALLSAGYIKASLEEWGEDIVSANISTSSLSSFHCPTSFIVLPTALGRVWYEYYFMPMGRDKSSFTPLD